MYAEKDQTWTRNLFHSSAIWRASQSLPCWALVCVFFLFQLTPYTLLIGAALLAITLGASYLTLQKTD